MTSSAVTATGSIILPPAGAPGLLPALLPADGTTSTSSKSTTVATFPATAEASSRSTSSIQSSAAIVAGGSAAVGQSGLDDSTAQPSLVNVTTHAPSHPAVSPAAAKPTDSRTVVVPPVSCRLEPVGAAANSSTSDEHFERDAERILDMTEQILNDRIRASFVTEREGVTGVTTTHGSNNGDRVTAAAAAAERSVVDANLKVFISDIMENAEKQSIGPEALGGLSAAEQAVNNQFISDEIQRMRKLVDYKEVHTG